jgi:hypothetical protein
VTLKTCIYFIVTAVYAFGMFKLIATPNKFTNFDYAIGIICIVVAACVSLKEEFKKRRDLKEKFKDRFTR